MKPIEPSPLTRRVVGTAGHVDHGKSTLVQRLTGIDPDRLAEEKARAMTIDLGFAWLTLPDGVQVGLVDVPGHRDFIANMLAGMGGIDAALLVVAADEGVMPQTREHLTILSLLDVRAAVVALTKTDLIEDADWLALVEQEVRDELRDTPMADAPVVPVSALTGDGLEVLVAALSEQLRDLPERPELGSPRLPVDRVFSLSGFGTVVTGTLTHGSLRVGDTVELQPSGLRARVRGLQSYEQPVNTAYPGSRVAANLTGVDRQEIHRGEVLTLPGHLLPTTLTDVRVRLLSGASRPLKHDTRLKFYCGSAESNARVRLLSHETLLPGEDGWLQLVLDAPTALSRGDRFILRVPSPAETIGGGVVVDAHPQRRHKRQQADVLKALELRLTGTPAQRLAQLAKGPDPMKQAALAQAAGMPAPAFAQALDDALSQALLIAPDSGSLINVDAWRGLQRRLVNAIADYHDQAPLRRGLSREALRSQLGVKPATLALLLEANPEVVQEGGLVRLADHKISFSGETAEKANQLRAALAHAPMTPPSWSEAVALAGEDVVRALVELDEIVHLGGELIFARTAYDTLMAAALHLIDTEGLLAANTFRDHVGTSRKYAIGLLEHLDSLGVTTRVGDTRVRGPNASTPASAD